MGNNAIDGGCMAAYRGWLEGDAFDEATKQELRAIEGDEREIEDRFYRELAFGTAGLRGILGAGTNRMNIYTVGKVTQGLCDALRAGAVEGIEGDSVGGTGSVGGASGLEGKKSLEGAGGTGGAPSYAERGVVIAYDPRRRSREFAHECACIIAANGIKAYVFDGIRPTPELSFALLRLGCAAGIMVTASHNPSAYNGYKVYGPNGAQMSVADAGRVAAFASAVPGYGAIRRMPEEDAAKAGLVETVGANIDDEYVRRVRGLGLRLGDPRVAEAAANIKIVYTPLHGAAEMLVRRTLTENGFRNLFVVPEQERPDPDFPTVESPNPENRAAFDIAIAHAQREGANVIIGTDPDGDRIGVVFRDLMGEYVALTGNQIGCLLLEYVLGSLKSTGRLHPGSFAITTIVSSKLAMKIAAHYGVELHEVYTGFKYICGLSEKLERQGGRFTFGFEESNGYLAGTFVRDKDGVIATMLVAEMAAWLHSQGRTLAEALDALYGTYGYMADDVVSYTLEGKAGLDAIASTMGWLRSGRPAAFGEFRVASWRDYVTLESFDASTGKSGAIDMPETSDVLAYTMTDGSGFLIRPSGTEPKIKLYYGASAPTRAEAEALMRRFQGDVSRVVKGHLGI